MIDTSLLFTIGLIFLATFIGSYLHSRRKDPCLQSFAGFHVTLEQNKGKVIWGILDVETSGLELNYRDDVQDEKHLESSYIIYAQEFNNIQALYRFADELTAENREKRRKDIKRSFHPGPLERAKRGFRRFVGTASDSLSEVVGLLVGRAKEPAGRYITDKGERYLNQISTNLIGHAGSTFDPLLERYIGQKVVIEIMEDDEIHEHVGIFKNYSPDFLEILDIQFPLKQTVTVGLDGYADAEFVQAEMDGTELTVSNPRKQPLLLHTVIGNADIEQAAPMQRANGTAPLVEEMINSVVNGGERIALHLPKEYSRVDLHVRVVRELDMVVPRKRAVLRHRAERYESEVLPEIVFDVGFILNPSAKMKNKEQNLRRKLDSNANDALAAANLGTLLMQQKKYEEAERWLLHALTMRLSLPDNGHKATLQLRELNRHRSGTTPRPRVASEHPTLQAAAIETRHS